MRAALLKAQAKKKKFQKRRAEVVPDEDSDASLSSDDEEEYSENMIGKLLNKKYLVLKYLGRGTFSKVWLVLDIVQNDYLALKVQEPDDLDEMEHEIKVLNMIESNSRLGKKIEDFEVKVHGYQTHAMVMELLGDNIGNIIGEIPSELRLKTIKRLFYEIVEGIEILHKHNIIHLDMKVDNILLTEINPEINNYINEIKDLDIHEYFEQLMGESLPKELNLLDKKKRKMIKKKIKLRVLKNVGEHFFKDVNKINTESLTNLKLDIQELNPDEDIEDSITENETLNYNWDSLHAKIIDLGNSDLVGEIEDDEQEVYTRSYRPPENIIHKIYSTKSDIWFLGCLLYELLTEEILFDIDIDSIDKNKRDREHLRKMHQLLGHIPREMLHYHQLPEEVLDFNRFEMEDMSLRDNLTSSFDIPENELDLIEDLMFKILEYNPEVRYSATDILKHKWFST